MKMTDLSRYSILLVDDVAFSRHTVFKMLTDLGTPEVHQAEDGEKALEILQSGEIVHFILSDFKMPNFNGLQLLKAVRTGQTGVGRDTPFAMLTGYSDSHLVDMALALGVNAFFTKPVSKKTLSTRLGKMLSRGGGAPLQPVDVYQGVTIEKAEVEVVPEQAFRTQREPKLENSEITEEIVDKISSLRGRFKPSDLSRNITDGVDRLVTDSSGGQANRLIAFINKLIGRGVLELEDVPEVLDARDSGPKSPRAPAKRTKVDRVRASPSKEAGEEDFNKLIGRGVLELEDVPEVLDARDSGPKSPRAPAKRTKVDRVRASPSKEAGEEDFYRLADVPLGAVLSQDILTDDGSVLIRKDTGLTQQVIAILAHLRSVDAVRLPSMEKVDVPDDEPDGPGVFANFYAKPDSDGAQKAFDSENPPSERLKQAMRGGGSREIPVSVGEISESATLARDIYTTDGRLYMYAESELTLKIISILRDLDELGHLKTKIWITT